MAGVASPRYKDLEKTSLTRAFCASCVATFTYYAGFLVLRSLVGNSVQVQTSGLTQSGQ